MLFPRLRFLSHTRQGIRREVERHSLFLLFRDCGANHIVTRRAESEEINWGGQGFRTSGPAGSRQSGRSTYQLVPADEARSFYANSAFPPRVTRQ